MKTASWVIVHIATGQAVAETFSKSTADAIDTAKYKAVPILEYLCTLNKSIEANAGEMEQHSPLFRGKGPQGELF